MRKYLYVTGVAIVSIVYLAFSSPKDVVIDKNGSIVGIQNKIRHILQQEDFLVRQRNTVTNKIKYLKDEQKRDKEFETEINHDLKEHDKEIEKLYKDYPKLRPSKAELEVERLREQADKIEEIEFKRTLNRLRLEDIKRLEQIKTYLQEQLGNHDPLGIR